MTDFLSIDLNEEIEQLADESVHREREVRTYQRNMARYKSIDDAIAAPEAFNERQRAAAAHDKQHIRAAALADLPDDDAEAVMSMSRKARYRAMQKSEREQCCIAEDGLREVKAELAALLAQKDPSAGDDDVKAAVSAAMARFIEQKNTARTVKQ